MRCEPGRAESPPDRFRRLHGWGGSAYPSSSSLELFLQFCDLAAQLRDGASILCAGLPQRFNFCSRLFARNASDFGFQYGCEICHSGPLCILKIDEARLTAVQ